LDQKIEKRQRQSLQFFSSYRTKKSVPLYFAPALRKMFPNKKNTFLRKKKNESSCGMIGVFSKPLISQSGNNEIL